MRILFLILLITLATNVIGQLQNKLEGTWKVIAISDNEMSINFNEDSVSFSKTAEIDTLTAKPVVKALLSLFGKVLYI